MDPNQPQANDSTYQDSIPEEKPFPWLEILSTVWFHRKRIAIFVVATTIIAVGITFLISPLYTAETSILPELMKERALGLAGLASIAEATGLNVGETPVSKLYPIIVRSERVLHGVIYHRYPSLTGSEEMNLAEYWGISAKNENEQFEKALQKLRSRMDVSFDMRLGTVNIAVEMEKRQLAADVANQITKELDDYTRTKRKTNATLQREFIEQRMNEVEEALERSEVVLKEFRERNRRILDSPQLILEQERLSRDVQINSTVFIELKKQLEVAKIDEIKNIPIINVLDAARPPVKKSYPRRGVVTLVTSMLSLVFAIAVAAYGERSLKTLKTLNAAIRHDAAVQSPPG